MTLLRFTRAEAEAEAIRLAEAFVVGLPGCASLQCVGALPDWTMPGSHASKHPVAWLVVFLSPGATMNGGELFVAVNLETNAVAIR